MGFLLNEPYTGSMCAEDVFIDRYTHKGYVIYLLTLVW